MKNSLFGAAYYDEYMPYDRIDTDFKLMKDAGMNTIRIAESTWSTWEPSDNRFDFSHLHHMLDYATKYDINIIVGTPTYAVPSWLVKKHPDILATTKDGQLLYGHRQLTDITNSDYLFHAERIIRKLMEEVKDHPKVIGYQIDNETRAADAAGPAIQQMFFNSMKEKYPDIDEFNHEFGLDYWSNRIDSWDDFPDIRGTINGSLSAAYKAFLRNVITDFHKWQADIIREYSRPDQFITHNFDYYWIGSSYGIQPLVDQEKAAACMDIAGTDIYHLSQDRFDGATIAFGGAVTRSLKKDNYLVLETQSQGRQGWLPYPGQIRQAYYSHFSSGANSVMYWNWHSIHNAIESYWMGVLSHNLTPGRTYQEIKEVRNEALSFDEKLINLKKNCKIAILIDNRSLTGLDEFPCDDTSDESFIGRSSEEGTDFAENPDLLTYNHILRWMYDSCYELNLEADMIYAADLYDEAGSSNEEEWIAKLTNKYPLLLVPALYSATEETIAALRTYVKNGGHLLLGFRSLFSDEELKIYSDIQPHGMTDLVGGYYDQFTRPIRTNVIFCDAENKNKAYQTAHWMELLIPEDADIWARYEHPMWKDYCAVLHKTDKEAGGSTTYLGCYMEKDGFKTILKKLASIANIKTSKNTFPVIIKTGCNSGGNTMTFLFNYSSDARDAIYEGVTGTELITGEKVQASSSLSIEPWGVKIIESK